MRSGLWFLFRERRHISCNTLQLWMSRQPYNRVHKWSFARDTESSGIELWNRSGMSTMCIHPDTIHHQVDDPLVEIYSHFIFQNVTLYILPYHHMPYIQLPANTFHCEERLPQDRSNLLVLLSCKLISASRYSLNRLVLLMTLSASLYPQSFCKFLHNHKNYKRKVQSLNQRKRKEN